MWFVHIFDKILMIQIDRYHLTSTHQNFVENSNMTTVIAERHYS